MKRPKIEFKKMSHPNFPAWDLFAKECYEYMDYIENDNKVLKTEVEFLEQDKLNHWETIEDLKLHNEKMRKAMASMGVSITKNEK